MEAAKLAALLAVAVAVCAVAAAPATAAYSGGVPAAPESCDTQITYFTNCLARDEIRGQCCSVVESPKCLCQLKREVELPCKLHRRHARSKCPREEPAPPSVKMDELKSLPCFKKLKC